MSAFPLRVQTLTLPADLSDDEALGAWFVELLTTSLARGSAGPVAVVVRGGQVRLIGLSPELSEQLPIHVFVAGLSGGVEDGERPTIVGLAGRFVARRPGRKGGAPVALVFLEWPDCRWWSFRLLLDAEGRPLPDAEQQLSATAGDTMPPGLGRWWSHQRRTGVTVTLGPPVMQRGPEADLVH